MLNFIESLRMYYASVRRSVEVSTSDFETHTEALRFRQEGHPELKCYSALIIV